MQAAGAAEVAVRTPEENAAAKAAMADAEAAAEVAERYQVAAQKVMMTLARLVQCTFDDIGDHQSEPLSTEPELPGWSGAIDAVLAGWEAARARRARSSADVTPPTREALEKIAAAEDARSRAQDAADARVAVLLAAKDKEDAVVLALAQLADAPADAPRACSAGAVAAVAAAMRTLRNSSEVAALGCAALVQLARHGNIDSGAQMAAQAAHDALRRFDGHEYVAAIAPAALACLAQPAAAAADAAMAALLAEEEAHAATRRDKAAKTASRKSKKKRSGKGGSKAQAAADARAAASDDDVALEQETPAAAAPVDAPHEDDDLCVCCLDAERDTPLSGCVGVHPPAVCAGCAALLLHAAAPACPLCRAPIVALL
jgi:hypothetical protein